MDAFINHVEEIKEKGFDTILFCISETDMLYNLEVFEEFRVYAENNGLVTWATFWGYDAGEAVTTGGYTLFDWIEIVREVGFKNYFIDEPKSDITQDCNFLKKHYPFLSFHLCLTDDTFNKMPDEEIKSMSVKSIGVSNYHWVKDWQKIIRRSDAIAERLQMLRPNDNFVFIQGFDIPEGWERIPIVVKETCEHNGIINFGFWSFRATAATSSKRPVNHKQIWEKIKF